MVLKNCKIELVEACPCSNIEELRKREGHYIKNEKCVNLFVAGRSRKEWQEENKEHFRGLLKQWEERNKEKRQNREKEYYTENKEHIKDYLQNCDRNSYITIRDYSTQLKSKSELQPVTNI